MEILRKNTFTPLLALALCLASYVVKGSSDTTRTDTVSALVVYGDEKLLDAEEALTDERLDHLLDSLCTLDDAPQDLIEDLLLFKRIRGLEVDQMLVLIDSLFELDTVPYALINEIN